MHHHHLQGPGEGYASSMAVAGAADVVAGSMAVFFVVMALVAVVGLWWTTRVVRRWRRGFRSMLTREGLTHTGSTVVVSVAALSVTDRAWWVVQRDRHRMWRAVTAAERAVAAAVTEDAPIGDLPALTRHLLRTAGSVDAALRACERSSDGLRPLRQQVTEVVNAAREIQAGAVEALTAIAVPATTGLTDAVRTEVAAVRHGLTVSAAPPQ
jgi:hypothetical protein